MRTESRSGQVLNNTSVSHKAERRAAGTLWSQNTQLFSIQAIRKHIAGHYQHGNLREQWTQRNSIHYDRRLNGKRPPETVWTRMQIDVMLRCGHKQ